MVLSFAGNESAGSQQVSHLRYAIFMLSIFMIFLKLQPVAQSTLKGHRMEKQARLLPNTCQTHTQRRASAGFTLAEVLVSMSALMVAITGIAALNSSALALTRSGKQTVSASMYLQERVEQLRSANWQQITSANYLRDSVFSSTPRNGAGISPVTETLTLTAHPDPTATEPLQIRKSNSAVTLVKSGSGLANQSVAALTLQVQWVGKDGRTRSRELSTILSRAGVSRVNLSWQQPVDVTAPR
jgi:Tfp pilus assembly protein PilV